MGKGRHGRGERSADRFMGSRSRREQIKDAQLCAAVRETLSLVLAESRDERLLEAFVDEVVPAPDASRLAVRVVVPASLDLDEVHDALARLGPRLRAEIAEAIARKRTPNLTFEVRPQGVSEP